MKLSKEDKLKLLSGGGGHVVILGAGASIASTIRNPELSGRSFLQWTTLLKLSGFKT